MFWRIVKVEIAVVVAAFSGFNILRRRERSRFYLYRNYPKVLDCYYWAEDRASWGQLFGTRLRHSDINRWLKEVGEVEGESD